LFSFSIDHRVSYSNARAGRIVTAHGEVQTPIFMPVGTAGTVKGVHQYELKEEVQAQIILGNTYHLYLRPGLQVMEEAGGLHRFMGWDRSLLTDSGGYQVFSLSGTRKISEEGVTFRSHIDGSTHLFTPESVMDIQRIIGADIIMAFDECPPADSDHRYARQSMELTHRWLDRCIARFNATPDRYGYTQHLFPIVQGGVYRDLRKLSCDYVRTKDTEGYAIGGLSVGEPEAQLYDICGWSCEHLPLDRPRYLMGVGTPWNLLECIALGVDMFDCVMPTRNARNGMLFTKNGILNMRNEKWKTDDRPLDEEGTTGIDKQYSRAYLRHLFIAEERLAGMIASVHNLAFYLALVKEARSHILAGTFGKWKQETTEKVSRRI